MEPDRNQQEIAEEINLPAPTAWPAITAFGITLLLAGLVTHPAVSFVGAVLLARGAVGWFRDVFPVEKHEAVPVERATRPPSSLRIAPKPAPRFKVGEALAAEGPRIRIPVEIHPYSAGVKGGIVGGVAMAMVACAYGLIAYGSIWYPINLLAASAMPSMATAGLDQLKAFDATAFIIALVSHGIISMLVGLLFAVLLPMLPSRRSAFFGSFISPIIWSALVWATLRLINPALDARIDWRWFIASQVAFGLTAGYVVHHSKLVETIQSWPLAARAGIEIPGLLHEKEGEQ